MRVGIIIVKWDNTCHSQHHGTEPPVHFCCSHWNSPCFLSIPLSFSLSLSLSSFSLSLSVSLSLYLSLSLSPSFSLSMSLCGCKTRVIWCSLPSILFLINLTFHALSLHSSYKIHQPFADYLLRLPSSELLEKGLFRSRANRRLVYPKLFPGYLTISNIQSPHLLPVRIRYRSEGQAAWQSPPEG